MDRGQASYDEGLNGGTGQSGVSSSGVTGAAGQAMDQVKQKKDDVMHQQVAPRVERQMTRAAEQVRHVAEAVRKTGDSLRDGDSAFLADWTDRGATQLDHFADYLHDADVNRIVGDVEHFARRQPALFLGGAFALGLMAARFFKASAPSPQREYGGYGGYGYRSSQYGMPRPGFTTHETEMHAGAYGDMTSGTGQAPGTRTPFGSASGGTPTPSTERTGTIGSNASSTPRPTTSPPMPSTPSTTPTTPPSTSTGSISSSSAQPGQRPNQGIDGEDRGKRDTFGSSEVH